MEWDAQNYLTETLSAKVIQGEEECSVIKFKLWCQLKSVLMWSGLLVNVTCGLLLFYHRPHPLLMAQQPLVSQGLLTIEASRLHSDTPQSVGLLWTSHQPDAETTTWQFTKLTRDVDAPDVIWTRNPGKRAAADPRLTPRGHWDQHAQQIPMNITIYWKITPCIPMSTTLHGVILTNITLQLNLARAPNITETRNINIWKKKTNQKWW